MGLSFFFCTLHDDRLWQIDNSQLIHLNAQQMYTEPEETPTVVLKF